MDRGCANHATIDAEALDRGGGVITVLV